MSPLMSIPGRFEVNVKVKILTRIIYLTIKLFFFQFLARYTTLIFRMLQAYPSFLQAYK